MSEWRHFRDYSVLRGRYFKVFAEPDVAGGFVWYLSDHENAADDRPLPSVPPCPGRRFSEYIIEGDSGQEQTPEAAMDRGREALAELERRQTLAWIACRPVASRWWPRSMFPGVFAREMIGQPGSAAGWAWHVAWSLRLSFQYLPERT